MTPHPLQDLSNDALLDATARAAANERRSTAELLALLMEVERRRLHLALGHSSLFVYCVRALHLSEQAAYSRITAARAARRYPQLLQLLADAALSLSGIERLAPHLTNETVEPLLEAARFKSTREIERLVAGLYPEPETSASFRAVPSLPSAPVAEPLVLNAPSHPPEERPLPKPPRPIEPPRRPVAVGAKQYYLKLTVDQHTHDKLERLRALLRHSIPDGDLTTIVDRALTLLIEDTERKRFASTHNPRAASAADSRRRHVPAEVRRTVWRRDDGRCAFVGAHGRCGETAFLEFHHLIAFAKGGPTTAANLELRCRAHNAYEAELEFGP